MGLKLLTCMSLAPSKRSVILPCIPTWLWSWFNNSLSIRLCATRYKPPECVRMAIPVILPLSFHLFGMTSPLMVFLLTAFSCPIEQFPLFDIEFSYSVLRLVSCSPMDFSGIRQNWTVNYYACLGEILVYIASVRWTFKILLFAAADELQQCLFQPVIDWWLGIFFQPFWKDLGCNF